MDPTAAIEAPATSVEVDVVVNSTSYRLELDGTDTLFDALRERLGLVGTKAAPCSPTSARRPR